MKLPRLANVMLVAFFFSANSVADQVFNTDITNEWPNNRYTVHGDGTVTDTVTGLMWQQCSQGQIYSAGSCIGDRTDYSWEEALNLAESEIFAGYSDWRLPNVKELLSLVALDRNEPAINIAVFPNGGHSYYRTGSPGAWGHDYSWLVHFGNGNIHNSSRIDGYTVRLVRSGQ